jgi:TetR/AcrR family transcriptional repressor of nem operon
MARKSDSKEKLLATARAMFLERGYPATSLGDLVAGVGVTKGSFFHHFQSKEELALEVLLLEFEQTAGVLSTGPFSTASDPMERVLGFIDHTDRHAEALWARGSLLGAFAANLAATSPRIEALVSKAYRRLVEGIGPLFEPVAERTRGRPDAAGLAEHFLAVIEGGATLARVHDDPHHLHQALANFRRYVVLLTRNP